MLGRPPAIPRSRATSLFVAACATLATAWGVSSAGCAGGCGGDDRPAAVPAVADRAAAAAGLPSPGTVAGVLDSGAESPRGDGPWTIGIALFDTETLVPGTLELLDDPALWTTRTIRTLPAEFAVDIGAPYEGWVVVVLDDDGDGLLDTPRAGDLVGVSAEPVQSPVHDVRVFLEEVWDR